MSCKTDTLMDKHHIIPRHAGGSDDYTNIVKINRTQHMMFHFCNYQLWGREGDLLAYKGLSKQIDKTEIIRAIASTTGKKCYEEGKGIFSLTREERMAGSSKGGKKAGKYMSNSMWVTNGSHNMRIQKTDDVPDGYRKGKTNINQVKKVKERGRTQEEWWAEKRADYERRREYLDKIEDLGKYGIRQAIANDWGISRTQVNRFIAQHYQR